MITARFLSQKLFFSLILFFITSNTCSSEQITTLYGSCDLNNCLIEELIASSAMQRLKSIDQSGPCLYFKRAKAYNRFDHSIGVWFLLKKFQASETEQVAGLLHDASHTVFSHTGDWVFFQGSHENAYQDDIHLWYLKSQNIGDILSKYGLELAQADVKGNKYLLLDQSLPNICADRLEYNLYTGHLFGFLTDSDINNILNDIKFKDGNWFFEDPAIAAQFAYLSLYFTEHFWSSDWNVVLNEWFAQALKRALELQLVTLDDIHFGKDEAILNLLESSNDKEIQKYIKWCTALEEYYDHCSPEEASYSCFPKFRGIDPFVKIHNQLIRLTAIDLSYAEEFNRVKKLMKQGIHIKFKQND